MSTLFAGNVRNLLIKKQVDKTTAVASWTDAMALRVYEFTRGAARQIGALAETDATIQQGASKVQSVGPSLAFGLYGRPTELVLLNELILGLNDGGGTSPTDTATPDQNSPYFGILDVTDYGTGCPRFDGCRIASATYTAADTEGDTFLKLTGISVMARSLLHGVAAPVTMPTPVDEDPFIFAECAVSYDAVHPGVTKAFTINVNRNTIRAQGDSGFPAFDIVHGLFQVDGTLSRYTQDDTLLRTIDTGTAAGTALTQIVDEQALAILFTRVSPAASFLIASAGISYEGREEAIDASTGNPYVEVLTVRTQPQTLIADNLSMVVEV